MGYVRAFVNVQLVRACAGEGFGETVKKNVLVAAGFLDCVVFRAEQNAMERGEGGGMEMDLRNDLGGDDFARAAPGGEAVDDD